MSKEYTIVRLSSDIIKDMATLHSRVYSTSVSEEYFKKKYNTVYTGIENVGFLAYDKRNEPVAYYGVIPCFIRSGNELILAAQSADTMTHPQHRYKGMFVELSNMTFDLCKSLNIRLVFGFPNQNSYHGAVTKLGWEETETMNLFTVPVKTLPLYSLCKKIKCARLYRWYKEFILKKMTVHEYGISNSVIKDGFAGVYRSGEYLMYKSYNPTKVLQIGDCKIWISSKQSLLIGDMEGVNENNFDGVIRRLKSLAKRSGIRKLQFICCQDLNLNRLFASSFKGEKAFPVLFQDLGSPVPLHKIKFVLADIDIF